ncbi:MAG: hypothetical protein ACI8V7_000071 [Candidatus Paceibacteria bacterium]|jgi:hypothetical protein
MKKIFLFLIILLAMPVSFVNAEAEPYIKVIFPVRDVFEVGEDVTAHWEQEGIETLSIYLESVETGQLHLIKKDYNALYKFWHWEVTDFLEGGLKFKTKIVGKTSDGNTIEAYSDDYIYIGAYEIIPAQTPDPEPWPGEEVECHPTGRDVFVGESVDWVVDFGGKKDLYDFTITPNIEIESAPYTQVFNNTGTYERTVDAYSGNEWVFSVDCGQVEVTYEKVSISKDIDVKEDVEKEVVKVIKELDSIDKTETIEVTKVESMSTPHQNPIIPVSNQVNSNTTRPSIENIKKEFIEDTREKILETDNEEERKEYITDKVKEKFSSRGLNVVKENDYNFTVSGKTKAKLFGFIPVKIKHTIVVEKGSFEVEKISKSWWSIFTF